MKIFQILMIILILIITFYIITRIQKRILINKISNKTKWLSTILIVSIIMLLPSVYKMTIIIIMMHWTIILLIGDLLYKISKEKINYKTIMIISILLTLFYILYAWFNAYNIKETKYTINSNKVINNINIVQITDTHIGTTFDGIEFKKYLDNISKINPDVLVITGDFIDENTSYDDLKNAIKSLSETKTKYGIYMIFGNHDITRNNNRKYTNQQLRNELKINNIVLLEDEFVLINDTFYLIGRRDKTNINRLSLKKIIKDIDKNKIMITLDHHPTDYEENIDNNIDLVLSGHTHGGQLLPLKYGITILNQMAYGNKKINDTTFIVSSGLSGWGTPLKTGTINEYVNITITK